MHPRSPLRSHLTHSRIGSALCVATVAAAVASGVVVVGWLIRNEGARVRREMDRPAGASANGLDPETVAAARSIARHLIS